MSGTDIDEPQEFRAPDNGGWHYTIMRDWIAVCPDISPTAARLYWIIRSIMHEKGDRKRRLSIDQLCWLLPGINGKPTGSTRVDEALRELKKMGLLSNPDGDVVRRWVIDPCTGKQTRENFRRWQIHDYPRAGYGGPKSAIELLDDYPGPGWRETPTSTETRISGARPQTTHSPGKTPKTPGHTESRKSGSSSRKSGSSSRKSGDAEPLARKDFASKESPQGIIPTNQTARVGSDSAASAATRANDDGWLDTQHEQDREAGSLTATPAPPPRVANSSGAATAKTEQDQEKATIGPDLSVEASAAPVEGETSGAGFLRGLRASDGTGLAAYAVAQHEWMVSALLVEHSAAVLSRHLTSGAKGGGFIKAKLDKLADGSEALPERPGTQARTSGLRAVAAAVRDGCADCDCGWIRQPDGRERKCPNCFPAPAGQAA